MKNKSQTDKKPVLIYDGDCEFCRLWVARCRSIVRGAVDCHPAQQVGENYPQISAEQFESSVYLIDPDGRAYSGAEAVFKALAYASKGKWLLAAYEKVPGVAPLSEWGYKQVAKNRKFFGRLTRWFKGGFQSKWKKPWVIPVYAPPAAGIFKELPFLK